MSSMIMHMAGESKLHTQEDPEGSYSAVRELQLLSPEHR